MWDGLGSELVGGLLTAVVTIGAVWLTLRHERRQQDSTALEAELARLGDELRQVRRGLNNRTPGSWISSVKELPRFQGQVRRAIPAVRRELGDDVANLFRTLVDDVGDGGKGTVRRLDNLEAVLAWAALSPEVLTKPRIAELLRRRDAGEPFD